MIERWGSFVARRALAVLLAGLVVAFAAAAYGFGVFDSLSQGGFDDTASESARELALEQDTFGNQGIDVVAIYSSEDLTADGPGVPGRGAADRGGLHARHDHPGGALLRRSRRGRHGEQGRPRGAGADLAGRQQPGRVPHQLRRARADAGVRPDRLDTDLAGAFAVFDDVNEITTEDLARAEMISMPIVVVLAF